MENEWFDESIKELEKKLTLMRDSYEDTKNLLDTMIVKLKEEKQHNNNLIEKFQKYPVIQADIVEFNVGGQTFTTLRSTLTKKIRKTARPSQKKDSDDDDDDDNDDRRDQYYDMNVFEGILNGYIEVTYDNNKRIFIDRNPRLFGYVLDYLRTANTDKKFEIPYEVDHKELKKEAEFYNVDGLKDMILSSSMTSSILSSDQVSQLMELGEFTVKDNWKLVYSGKQDGFTAPNFHAKCDGVENTLVIIKSTNGNIFGGYTKARWDQSNQYKPDKNAFIFSLVNREKRPLRFNIAAGRESYAIFCTPHYGPTFGGGHDLFLSTNCHSDESTSNSNLGHCYRNADVPLNQDLKTLLGGTPVFKVEEIEIFARR